MNDETRETTTSCAADGLARGSVAGAAIPRPMGPDPLLTAFVGGIVSILVAIASLTAFGPAGAATQPERAPIVSIAAPDANAPTLSISHTIPGLAIDLAAAVPLAAETNRQAPATIPVRLAPRSVGRDAPTYVNFVLDASGSMLERAESGTTKIDDARRVVGDAIDALPDGVFASVRVFGHRVAESNRAESCRDSELIVPPMPGVDASRGLKQTRITPRGWTSLADNLRRAARGFPGGANHMIVMVSDGKETCDGDPVAVAREIRASDQDVAIHTVGFGVDATARAQLREIAQLGGGTYQDAASHAGLVEALKRIGKQAVAQPIY